MTKQVKIFQTGIGVFAALALGACSSLRPGQAGTLESSGRILSAQETAIRYHIDEQWWRAYRNPALNALMDQALANNTDLKKAAVAVNKALYQARISGAAMLPSLDGSLSGGTQANLKTGDRADSLGSRAGLSYELDLWRKLSAQAGADVSAYEATRYDLAAAKLSLINSVADAYFNIAYLDEAIALSEQTLERYQEIARIAKAQYREGKVSSADPRQSDQTLLGTRNNLLALKKSRDSQQEILRNLLNLKPEENEAGSAYRLSDPINVDLDVPVSTLAARPDLRAAEARLQAAADRMKVQRRSWYPSISLSATLSTSSDKAKTMFNVPFLAGNVALNLPFLDWKNLRWKDKTVQAEFDEAGLDFEKALTTALNEVNTYYLAYEKARDTLANTQEKYKLDKENSRYYQVRYRHGKNGLKDWLDALNTEYASAQDVLNQRYEVLRYENMIFKAMAGRYGRKNQ